MSVLSETCFRTTQEVLKNGHGHLEEFIQSLNDQISTLRREINFLREELKEKDNVIKILKVNFLSHEGCSERLSRLSTVNLKSILFQIKKENVDAWYKLTRNYFENQNFAISEERKINRDICSKFRVKKDVRSEHYVIIRPIRKKNSRS